MARGSWIVLLAAVLAAVGLGAMIDALADPGAVRILVPMLLSAILMVFAIVYRPEPRMPIFCDPFVLTNLFLAQFFLLGPIVVAVVGFSPVRFFTPPQPEAIAATLLAFFVMVLSSVLGCYSRLGILLADALPDFGPSPRKFPGWLLESVILVTSVGAVSVGIALGGGLFGFLSRAYGQRGLPPMFTLAHDGLLLGTLLLTWRVLNASRRRVLHAALLGMVVLFDVVYFGILLGVRKYLLFLFFGVLTIWLLRRGVKSLPKARTAMIFVLVLVYFSAWGSIRSRPLTAVVGMTEDIRYGKSSPGIATGYLDSIEGPFGGACKVMEIFPEHVPFRHGRTLGIVYFAFIPRALWPEKPIGLGKELTQYYEGPFYNPIRGLSVAPTVLGEFWANFGWFGIVGGGFFLGLVCRTVSTYAVSGAREGLQTRAARVLIPAVVVAGLGEVRADAAALLLTWGLQLVPLLMGLMFFNLDAEGRGARW